MANIKKAAIVPQAMFTGLKLAFKVASMRKRANKASKIFEKTLRKEGIPPQIAAELARVYRDAVPLPGSFSDILKHGSL